MKITMYYDERTILALVILLLYLAMNFGEVLHRNKIDNAQTELIEKRFNQLDSIMTHRSQLDSLYWNHLEECAFELKGELIYSQHN